MSQDRGAAELLAVLEEPSTAAEAAIEALATQLEGADAIGETGASLPAGARAPIVQLQAYYRRILAHVSEIQTGSPAQGEAIGAIRRMEGGLGRLAAAVDKEGEPARDEAKRGAVAIEQAEHEFERAIARLR